MKPINVITRPAKIFCRYIGLVGVINIILLSANVVLADEVPPSTARLGTSSVGSTFYVIANGLGSLMHKHANINMTVEPIGGSYANIFSLKGGKIDYALTNAGAAYDGRYGKYPFDEPVKISLLAQGQTSYRFILVRRDANIKSLSDLDGKIIIGKRPALPEIEELSKALINVGDLINVNNVSTKNTKETIRQLRAGTVAAAIIPGGARVASIVELFQDNLVEPLYLDKNIAIKMQNELPPYMFIGRMPAGHFKGQLKDFIVFGLNSYLVAGPQVSDKQAYSIIKILFDNHKEFSSFHSAAKMWTTENALLDPKIPFNKGAIKYFKEKGLWTEKEEHLQEKLLNR